MIRNGCGDAVVAQLTHHRDAVDVRKHAVDRDHGIVAGGAAAQRLAAAGGQIHLVTAGRELFHELAGGFRVVLDDQNTAVIPRHGPSPTIAASLQPNATAAIITMMWCGGL